MPSTLDGSAVAQVLNLYGHYAQLLDAGDADGWADCFTEEAEFTPNEDADPLRGRAAFVDFVRGTGEGRPRHLVLNVDVYEAGERTARSRANFLLLNLSDGAVDALGAYDDEAGHSEDGRWRFRRKSVRFLWKSERYQERARAIAERT